MTELEYKTAYERFKSFFDKGEWLSDEEYKALVRQYCVRAVYAFWNQFKQPVDYFHIVEWVMKKLMEDGLAEKYQRLPSKETIERRVRETVDIKFYGDGITPVIRVKECLYMPNPEKFDGEEKEKMKKIIEKFT